MKHILFSALLNSMIIAADTPKKPSKWQLGTKSIAEARQAIEDAQKAAKSGSEKNNKALMNNKTSPTNY